MPMFDYEEKRKKINNVTKLMEEGDWRSVLEAFEELKKLNISKISSVGCGCGTLEWIIQQALPDLEVIGYEVNKGWWESKHSTPHYIPLEYVDDKGANLELPSDSALLFCYFNNLEFFNNYIKNYKGECVILIGPIDGKRHCEPQPDYLEEKKDWEIQSRMLLDGGDEIAIYIRRNMF